MASVVRMMADRTLIKPFSPKEREESPPGEALGVAVGGEVFSPPLDGGDKAGMSGVGKQLGCWVGDAVGSRVGRREGGREGGPVGGRVEIGRAHV